VFLSALCGKGLSFRSRSRAFTRSPPISFLFLRDLCGKGFGVSIVGDKRICAPPTRPFHVPVANKAFPPFDACVTLAWPLGDPSVTLAWPLGDPSVTLGCPKGHPIPNPTPNPIPIGRGSQAKAARRKTGVLDEPAVGLAGWEFAAPQTVIVFCRRPKAGALSAVEGERSRQPNGPIAKCQLLFAFFKEHRATQHPEVLLHPSANLRNTHARTCTPSRVMSFATYCLTPVHVRVAEIHDPTFALSRCTGLAHRFAERSPAAQGRIFSLAFTP
jgi:hypothetical protein